MYLEREVGDAGARSASALAPIGRAAACAGAGALSAPRITGGTHRGRTLPEPIPADVRPTSSRVREAVFSLVGHDLTGCRVLDACGGTGLVGFEAASRGAEVVTIERSPTRARWIVEAAASLGLLVRVVPGDAATAAQTLGSFDGIYLDPPYAEDPAPLLARLADRCRHWLVLETRATAASPPCPTGFDVEPVRRYGEAAIRVFRRTGP